MTTPSIIANIGKGWNRNPAALASGSGGISAALWTHDSDDRQEVSSDPDFAHHHIAVIQKEFGCELYLDETKIIRPRVDPGSVQITRAGTKPRGVFKGAFEILHIYLPVKLIGEILTAEGIDEGSCEMIDPVFEHDESINVIATTLLREIHTTLPLSRLRVDALGLDLAIHVLRNWSSSFDSMRREQGRAGIPIADQRLVRAMDYLLAHLKDDVALDDVAREAQLSPRHFSRVFQQASGIAPHRWLVERRIERARTLLSETSLSVTDIALECGFSTSQHFATVFKMKSGISPSEYRRRSKL